MPFNVQQGDIGSIKAILLSVQALADINGALGGDIAVGCHNESISGSASQWVRFSMQHEPRIHQLVLTVL